MAAGGPVILGWVLPSIAAWGAPPPVEASCASAPWPDELECGTPGVWCVDGDLESDADFRTLGAADTWVQPGDTVVVKEGSYLGVALHTSGTSSAPITWLADGDVRIEYLAVFADHLRLRGFRMEGSPGACVAAAGFNDLVLTDLHLLDLTCVGSAQYGFALDYVTGGLIQGNRIEGYGQLIEGDGMFLTATHDLQIACNTVGPGGPAGRTGLHVHVGSGLEVERNVVWGARLDGMDLDGVTGSTLRDNLLFDNGRYGVRGVQEVALQPPGDLVLVSNTIVADESAVALLADQGGHTVFDNVLVGRTGYALAVSSNDLKSDFNVLAGQLSLDGGDTPETVEDWRGRGLDESSVYGPVGDLFVDEAGGDYRPTPASGAIDLGPTGFGGVTVSSLDLVGNPRPSGSGVDAGALETGAGCTPSGSPDPCNGLDDDCDGATDEDPVAIDADGDGWGGEPVACDPLGPAAAVNLGDCDDADPAVHPGATELPSDRVDQDCDGLDVAVTLSGGTCGCGSTDPGLGGWSVVLAVAVGLRRRGRFARVNETAA